MAFKPTLLAGLLAIFLLPLAALAQGPAPFDPPRTAEGRPDFQGVWANKWLTPLEKSPLASELVVSPEQAKTIVARIRAAAERLGQLAMDPELGDPDAHSLTIVNGEHRTRMLVAPSDGVLPYTPAGAQAAQRQMGWFTQRATTARGEGPEDRLTWERCLAGMGQAPLLYAWSINALRRVVQTRDALVVHSEAGGETRVIRIGGGKLPAAMRSFIGDSVGRWEGDVLVVETTGFRPDDQFRMFGIGRPIMVSPDAKVVERFSRTSARELNYSFTVEDPAAYYGPWMAEYALIASDEPMFEFACHEGNYGLTNILEGARARDRLAAAQAQTQAR